MDRIIKNEFQIELHASTMKREDGSCLSKSLEPLCSFMIFLPSPALFRYLSFPHPQLRMPTTLARGSSPVLLGSLPTSHTYGFFHSDAIF
jgi:hypothetical protein